MRGPVHLAVSKRRDESGGDGAQGLWSQTGTRESEAFFQRGRTEMGDAAIQKANAQLPKTLMFDGSLAGVGRAELKWFAQTITM